MSVDISQEVEARLSDEARKQGVSIDAFLLKLMDQRNLGPQDIPDAEATKLPMQAAADIILDSMRAIPSEITATMPHDGASQHDHYIYGWPKREV